MNNQKENNGFFATFISKPVLALVINIIIILVGIVSWNQISVRELPKITYPVISVTTEYPGSGPSIIESQITIPLEESFAGIEGLDYMQSTSTNGQSVIQLHFKNNQNIDAASADVRDRISKAKDMFPQGLRDPIIRKSGMNERSLMRLAAYSEKYSLAEITDFMQRNAKGVLESIQGVASVQISGAGGGGDSGAFQIHVTISPEKLLAYNLTIYEVRESIHQSVFKKPLGDITQKDISFAITLDQSAKDITDYQNIILKHHKQGVVRLSDIAKVEVIGDDPEFKVRYNGNPGITIEIVAQQEANPMETANNIKQKLEEIKKSAPKDLHLDIAYDKSDNIGKSIKSVYKAIFEAIFFVFLVMLLFLKSWRSTFIPMVTIPICILGGFFIIYLFGFTINTLTLLAIVLAIGLVVDDAIVVLENIYRYMERGLSPWQASIEGIKEIQFAIIAMTLTLIAVYAPITLSSGLIGKLFIEFAITLAGTVLISGLVALVLTPMLCSRILKSHVEERGWQILISNALNKLDKKYAYYLDLAIKNIKYTISFCLMFGFIGIGIARYYFPKNLMPELDNSYIILGLDSPSGATSQYIDKYAKKIEDIVKNTPSLSNYLTIIQSKSGHNGIYIKLVDPSKRNKTCKQILEELNKKIEPAQSGLSIRGYCESGQLGGDSESSNIVSLVIQSQKSYDEMEEVAMQFIRTINQHPGFAGNTLRTSRISPEKAYNIIIDREKAGRMNLRMHDISEMLSAVMRGQPPVDRFEKDGKRYPVKMMVSDEFRKNPENLKRFYMRSTKSADHDKQPPLVSLNEILEIKESLERPLSKRYEGMRAYEILFETSKGYTPIGVYNDISKILDEILPQGYKYSATGELRKTINESSSIMWIFLLALLFIFLIMAAQFESFIDPLMIMLTVPLALAGGIIILLFVPDASMNIFTYIALITLIGLITKHGILIVDFANKRLKKLEKTRINLIAAVKEASILRLRPILMTTAAMVLGAIPLAFASGSGHEIRSQIGWVIVGGMSIGTLFTIFLMPCVYILIKSFVYKIKE